jgi:hypothetical protein
MGPGKLTSIAAATAFSLLLAGGSAGADEWNRKTFLTFSGPVEIPGMVLPAGTYTFQIANPETSSRVIQVLDKSGTHVQRMFFALPTELVEAPDQPVVKFAERAEGRPEAIKAWFYPGERTGYEFVYPRSQAVKIARASHERVLSAPDKSIETSENSKPAEAFKNAKVERVDENGNVAEAVRPAVAPRTEPPRNETAFVQGNPQASQNSAAQLPKTASSLPLFQLVSVLSLAAGAGLRAFRAVR